jgi:hypothetical protein
MKPYHIRWALGLAAPLGGYVASRLLSPSANGDYRTGAWMLPIGAGIGSVLLLWRTKDEKVSLLLTTFGFVCAAVAIFYASIYTVFNGWMHGL